MLWLLVALERKVRKYGVLLHQTSFTVILAAYVDCTQRVPKPDMHNMEGMELYLGREGIM